jgi:hypothetical protein
MTQPKDIKRYQIFVGTSCIVDQNTPITQSELINIIHEYNAKIIGHIANSEYERYTLQKNVIKGIEALKYYGRIVP